MGTINNIFNLKIHSVSSAGSVNFGNTVNIGAESNSNPWEVRHLSVTLPAISI